MDSDSDEDDAYAQRLKNQREANSADEDEDSPDEDFVAPSVEEGPGCRGFRRSARPSGRRRVDERRFPVQV